MFIFPLGTLFTLYPAQIYQTWNPTVKVQGEYFGSICILILPYIYYKNGRIVCGTTLPYTSFPRPVTFEKYADNYVVKTNCEALSEVNTYSKCLLPIWEIC